MKNKVNTKRNKVLLVHPEISHTKYNFDGVIENEPLELEYIVPILKDRSIECEIFDVQRESISLTDKIKEYKPDTVYMCGRIKQENFMKAHIKNIKKINPNIQIIVGGLHVQKNYDLFFMNEVDYILTTFDVFKIIDLLNDKNIKDMSGICYKKNNKWIVNNAEAFDINLLPHPDRTYFYNHLNHYRYLELYPCAQVRTAYCCAFHCNFCYRNLTNCGKYVYRDIEDVVNEIEEIDCENIYFIDDDFLLNPKRLKRFIELVKERNIKRKYVCFGRADFIVNHKELIKELKDIGFYYILVGLEAINNDHLTSYNKLSNMDTNIDCVSFMNEIGINIMGMFIVDVDFTKKDFTNMYKWVKRHNLKHVAISIFTPIRGTKLYEEYKDKLITNNPEDFDYLHVTFKPTKISVKKYYFYYYILLIKLFLLAKRQGVYDFIDYGDYIKSFIKNIFKRGKEYE